MKNKANRKTISPAKKALIELSKLAQKAVKIGAFDSVNQFLVAHYAEKKGCTVEEFKTVPQWRELGMKVVKGTPASMVWARPRKSEKTTEAENVTTGQTETVEEKFRFWPTCNLFAPCDVEEMSDAMKARLASK